MEMIVVGPRTIKEVTDALNKRFKNQEDMEMRLDVYCLEVAQELDGLYDRIGETLLFRFGAAKEVKDYEKVFVSSPEFDAPVL